MSTERITIPIYGLSCASGDSLLLERALTKVQGVTRAYVNASTEMAYVEFDDKRCHCVEITRAIARTGLKAGSPNRCCSTASRDAQLS
jgi:cation transport ATPase